jgi:hypothetical protein
MSEIIQEITEWKCDYPVANNIYLLNDKGKVIAYIKQNENIIHQLKTPLLFDKVRRKFIKIKHEGLSKLIPPKEKTDKPKKVLKDNTRLFQVKSGDKVYEVEFYNNQLSCSCVGFGFRGKCKHVDIVRTKL